MQELKYIEPPKFEYDFRELYEYMLEQIMNVYRLPPEYINGEGTYASKQSYYMGK